MMIDKELEDFNEDRKKSKGLKTIIDFDTNVSEYEGSTFAIKVEPKFKKKMKASVYIKDDKSKGKLF
jgi:hypothetical protein